MTVHEVIRGSVLVVWITCLPLLLLTFLTTKPPLSTGVGPSTLTVGNLHWVPPTPPPSLTLPPPPRSSVPQPTGRRVVVSILPTPTHHPPDSDKILRGHDKPPGHPNSILINAPRKTGSLLTVRDGSRGPEVAAEGSGSGGCSSSSSSSSSSSIFSSSGISLDSSGDSGGIETTRVVPPPHVKASFVLREYKVNSTNNGEGSDATSGVAGSPSGEGNAAPPPALGGGGAAVGFLKVKKKKAKQQVIIGMRERPAPPPPPPLTRGKGYIKMRV